MYKVLNDLIRSAPYCQLDEPGRDIHSLALWIIDERSYQFEISHLDCDLNCQAIP